jgi:hypothetical protein
VSSKVGVHVRIADMKHVPRSRPPREPSRFLARAVICLVAAALLVTWVSDRSAARDHSDVLNAQSTALTPLVARSSSSASRRARTRRATKLRATTGCTEDHEPFVKFRWRPARKRGRAQRVQYTEFFHGFTSRDFHASRKLKPGKRRWRTAKIETGLDYSWRVMTRRAHRWVGSKVRPFDGPLCID